MLHYHHDFLHIDNINASEIAKKFGTPSFVYSLKKLKDNLQQFQEAFQQQKHLIAYAVKANSNLAILQWLAKQGVGFDIVSGGELARVLKAGGEPKKVVFSGVGKTAEEMRYALTVGVHCFNVESAQELFLLADIAKQLNKIAPIALRVNPDIDAKTHPYISTGLKENKFGMEVAEIKSLYLKAKDISSLKIIGIDCHIGSQITSLDPFLQAMDCLFDLIKYLKKQGISLQHVDIGGGLGIAYQQENIPAISEYIQALLTKLKPHQPLEIIVEPGRALIGNCAILLTQALYKKQNSSHHFLIVDAGMNDLLRPALYQAWHEILPVELSINDPENHYDIVGPVCETGDFLAKNRLLKIKDNGFIVIKDVGAYGFSMHSHYNSRVAACEILIAQNQCHIIRERESMDDLWRCEKMLDL